MNEKKRVIGRPFQKGVSGNPGGKPKLPDDIKAARKLSREDFIRILEKYRNMPIGEIKTIAEDQATPLMDRLVIAWLKEGLSGNVQAIDKLLDRWIGKVEAFPDNDEDSVKRLSMDELLEKSEAIVLAMKTKKNPLE